MSEHLPMLVPTPDQFEMANRLGSIFMPHAARQRTAVFGDNPNNPPKRMIHYTSAEAAIKMITSKRFWMRNANSMADYREVQHGIDIYNEFFSVGKNMTAFTTALDECAKGAAGEAIKMFDNSMTDIRFNTYIASMSQHLDHEDRHGRLSMWRGFGGNSPRVGVVLKIPWYSTGILALGLIFSPVAYLFKESTHAVINEVIAAVRGNCDYL